MHLPDGFISAPVNCAGYAVSAVVVGVTISRANRSLQDHHVPLLGMTAAFVFAAQMVNFPIGAGTSGHFLGAVLTAILLGPLNACLVMALVLTSQCLLFADGGLTALGTNIFNMGIIGGLGGYAAFALLHAALPKTRRMFFLSVAAASWLSVVGAASACAIELAVSGTVPLTLALPAMAGVHAIIGAGEAVITLATLSVVLAARPDLVAAWPGGSSHLAAKEAAT
jgi:cobalt/nickel transport system permease protein